MTELELLREEVDRLTARSWAQEAFLLYLLAEKGKERSVFLGLDTEQAIQGLHDQLRYSSLTDLQLTLFQEEVRAVLKRLQSVGDPTPPMFPF